MTFFNSHAGKSVLFIAGAAMLLGWPPSLPWIAAVALLQLGVKNMRLAFKEADRDISMRATAEACSPPVPAEGDSKPMEQRFHFTRKWLALLALLAASFGTGELFLQTPLGRRLVIDVAWHYYIATHPIDMSPKAIREREVERAHPHHYID